MRVVLDTNVVTSALLWGGIPEQLIEAAGAGSLELFTSEALVARTDAIVSGDADLHALGSYQGIPVLTPADCIGRIAIYMRDTWGECQASLRVRRNLIAH